MPLQSLLRLVSSILSWLILGAAVWLLWEWYHGDPMGEAQIGEPRTDRTSWLLWTGLGLLAWSFLGRFFWRFVLARPDDDPAKPERLDGATILGADNAPLYLEECGRKDGVPIILTHGAAMDSTAWYLAKKSLGERFRIVAWDLPGLGKSAASEISLEHYADALAAVVRHVGRPSVVVGHSMGGMTIQTLALRHPEMFGKEIIGVGLLNTTYTNPLKTMILSGLARALQPLIEVLQRIQIAIFPLAWLSAWQSYLSGATHIANRIACGKGITRTQLDHISLLAARNSPASIAKGNLAMLRWDATGAVANLQVPLLIVAGAGDIVTKPEASETIATTAVAPDVHMLPAANHMSFLDHASHYHALIEKLALDASAPKP